MGTGIGIRDGYRGWVPGMGTGTGTGDGYRGMGTGTGTGDGYRDGLCPARTHAGGTGPAPSPHAGRVCF